MKSMYIRVMRAGRYAAQRTGLLDWLERRQNRRALWIRSLFSIYDSADLAALDLPWWTFSAIDEVEAYLMSAQGRARVFEYGAGASTIWLGKRCAEVYSVEHDAGFASSMQPLFAVHDNVRVSVVPDTAATGVAGEARSRRAGYENRAFDDYVRAIDAVPGTFDLIVIDGRARNACLARAMERLAPGGMILFDNSDRKEYRASIMSSGLCERALRGAAPALPVASQTSLLTRKQP